MSPRKVNAGFLSYMGVSCATYVRETRLQEATRLLGNPKLDIIEIGFSVGYPNAANFSTAFKDRFGISPREYRQTRIP
jgi:transcriptional regulator GlxA family with amidase domain